LQSSILTKFVGLFTSSLTFHILRLLLTKVGTIANFEYQIHISHYQFKFPFPPNVFAFCKFCCSFV